MLSVHLTCLVICVPFIDRSLRLPLLLALLMVVAFVISRCVADRDLGYRNFGDNCGICHHGGTGQAGETPQLFGRVDLIAKTPEGKRYLIDVLLNGLNGPITASGQSYNYSMPSFRRLDDATIAQILSYASAHGQTHPAPVFTAAEVANARHESMPSWKVHDLRDKLAATTPLP
ncbi:cytochrome c-552 [Tanticharoenia sakaeratensis NBRC 103193]|uniref:Cytochrome c-552 n=1 Tax=Tanticharoenia sakaeratensis NBRC 103193 TaxID=1231623 RepID=A0A0D6MJ68_9PROT|nr:cytochrome c-552 [Tanticharoenia sakaeratensis NBRC 103193]